MIVRIILLILGMISGVLLASAAFYGFFSSPGPTQVEAPQAPSPPPVPTAMAVVAAKTLPTGTLIALQDLRFSPLANDQQTGGDVMRNIAANPNDQPQADKATFDQVAGAVTRRRFEAGAPIIRGDIVKPGDSGFLAAVLLPGKRALTIGVNAITGGAGLVFPGDHVDVILTQNFQGQEKEPGNRAVAEMIALDLRVIAVDQQLQANATPPKEGKVAQTVTLELDPQQAERIDVAAKLGELSLAIRGVPAEGDEKSQTEPPPPTWAHDVSPATAALQEQKNAAAPAPAAAAPPPTGKPVPAAEAKPQIRIIRGDKAENVALP